MAIVIFKVDSTEKDLGVTELYYIGPLKDNIVIEISKGCWNITCTFERRKFECKNISIVFNNVDCAIDIFKNCIFDSGLVFSSLNIDSISGLLHIFEGAVFKEGFQFPNDFHIGEVYEEDIFITQSLLYLL